MEELPPINKLVEEIKSKEERVKELASERKVMEDKLGLPMHPVVGTDHFVPIREFQDYNTTEWLVLINAMADGLNWEEHYESIIWCLYNFTDLRYRLDKAWLDFSNISNPEGLTPLLFGDIINLPEIYELLLAIGNISYEYKQCWLNGNKSLQ